MPNFDERALKLHKELRGKWGMRSKMPLENSDDLSIAYTPGVGAVSERIAEFEDEAHTLTMKGNSVAIISDGSAVLGLGNLGPMAALPVMEGKAILFNRFAGVDGVPIVVDSQDPDKIIEFVKMIAPTFGGINLEDIKAPECFIVEDALQDIGIPVFHDDQHGTAVVLLGALINAAKVVDRPLHDLKVVINGAGAAGTAIAKLLMCIGVDKEDSSPVQEVIICDSKGIISKDRQDLNDFKRRFLEYTNPRNISGSVFDALKGADVFIGVSKGNLLQKEDIQTMNADPIIFAMANPIPEIMPEVAYEGGAAIVGTGRSDLPNQVNNVLAFPGIFRGALDARAKRISEKMKIKAAIALAEAVDHVSRERILPDALDDTVAQKVGEAVYKVAKDEEE